MNKKIDRRSQRTRKLIFEAFEELISEKQFSKITVQDIIYKADIGRTTFYTHFETKDELLCESSKKIINHVFEEEIDFTSQNIDCKLNIFRYYILHVMSHFKDNKRIISSMLKYEDTGFFINAFKDYISKSFFDVIELKLDDLNTSEIDRNFVVNHIIVSFIQTIEWWYKQNLQESVEEITDYYIYTIRDIIDIKK